MTHHLRKADGAKENRKEEHVQRIEARTKAPSTVAQRLEKEISQNLSLSGSLPDSYFDAGNEVEGRPVKGTPAILKSVGSNVHAAKAQIGIWVRKFYAIST
jgi:hypothetical protein